MDGGGGAGAGDDGKVRVVRCPKCDKLLPELGNFTVYRCGGCNTTLQAKPQLPGSDTSSERSDGDNSAKIAVVLDGSSEIDSRREVVLPLPLPPLQDGCSTTVSEDGSDGDGGHRRPSKAPVADAYPDECVKKNSENARHATNGYRDNVQQKPPWRRDPAGRTTAASAFHRTLRPVTESPHLAAYPDEGPSNYHVNPAYRYTDAGRRGNMDVNGGIDHLEQDRAEILRKLDELRDQLSRSVTDMPKDRALRGTFYPESSPPLNHASGLHSRMDRLNLYPTLPAVSGVPGYREPLGRAAAFHPPAQYLQRPPNSYLYGQFDPDPVVSYHHDGFYRHDGFYHQQTCSCVHCYNNHWMPPNHAPLPVYSSNQRVPHPPNNNGFYPADACKLSYNQRVPNASLQPHEPRLQSRPAVTKKEGNSCRPIAGAAPFVLCHNCFKLLQVPEDFSLLEKSRSKLRCGSCSNIVTLKFEGGRLVTSAPELDLHEAPKSTNGFSDVLNEDLQSHNHVVGLGHPVSSYSEDYGSANYDFQSTDEKLVLPSPSPVSSLEMIEREYGLNLSEPEKLQGLSFSSTTSENLGSPDSTICGRDLPSPAELPLEEEATPNVASLALGERFECPPANQVTGRSGKGSRSKRYEQEKIVSLDANYRKNFVTVAAETDLSGDEYDNYSPSHDSWEADKDEDEPKTSKGGESFFAGLIKKSFKDFARGSQSLEGGKSKVSINGHPISHRVVKKAEKLAGPIYPGAYWYDYRAGFWGVIGNQCLGIIPPFIEEFNYPMPKSCAGGNTGVLVNGRELHQKDLDLLAGRGLPAIEGRSYIVEISGRIWDEASGEELDNLGKLAPTIEKVKHGFGLRVPKP